MMEIFKKSFIREKKSENTPPPKAAGYSLILLALFIFSAETLYPAPEPSVDASVSPLKGTVGQLFTYTVSIRGMDAGILKITLPEKKTVYPEKKNSKQTEDSPSAYVPVYIINNAARDDTRAGEIRLNMSLTYYRPGNYSLPEIRIAGKDGISIGYKIPSVTIEEINSSGNFEEIEPPVSLSGSYSRLIWITLTVIVLGAAAFFLYRYFKKKRKPVVIDKPSLPPIEIFLMEVDNQKLRELVVQERINEYVFTISIIFRRYLSMMLNFDAVEMTTDEIASSIKKFMPPRIYSACGEEIISSMRMWDLSKFAEFAPSRELLLNNIDATVSVAKKIHEMMSEENVSSGV